MSEQNDNFKDKIYFKPLFTQMRFFALQLLSPKKRSISYSHKNTIYYCQDSLSLAQFPEISRAPWIHILSTAYKLQCHLTVLFCFNVKIEEMD